MQLLIVKHLNFWFVLFYLYLNTNDATLPQDASFNWANMALFFIQTGGICKHSIEKKNLPIIFFPPELWMLSQSESW